MEYVKYVILVMFLVMSSKADQISFRGNSFGGIVVNPVSPLSYWADPYSNYYAVAYLSGVTNGNGFLRDNSINAKHADNVNGSAIVTYPAYTNINGRITYAQTYPKSASGFYRVQLPVIMTNVTAFTIVAWMRVDPASSSYAGIQICGPDTGVNGVMLMPYTTGGYGVIGCITMTESPWSDECSVSTGVGAGALTTNSWTYMGFSWSKPNKPIMKIGVNLYTNANVAWTSNISQFFSVLVGISTYPAVYYYKGDMGMFRVYTNYAFSATDFTNDMSHTCPTNNDIGGY